MKKNTKQTGEPVAEAAGKDLQKNQGNKAEKAAEGSAISQFPGKPKPTPKPAPKPKAKAPAKPKRKTT